MVLTRSQQAQLVKDSQPEDMVNSDAQNAPAINTTTQPNPDPTEKVDQGEQTAPPAKREGLPNDQGPEHTAHANDAQLQTRQEEEHHVGETVPSTNDYDQETPQHLAQPLEEAGEQPRSPSQYMAQPLDEIEPATDYETMASSLPCQDPNHLSSTPARPAGVLNVDSVSVRASLPFYPMCLNCVRFSHHPIRCHCFDAPRCHTCLKALMEQSLAAKRFCDASGHDHMHCEACGRENISPNHRQYRCNQCLGLRGFAGNIVA